MKNSKCLDLSWYIFGLLLFSAIVIVSYNSSSVHTPSVHAQDIDCYVSQIFLPNVASNRVIPTVTPVDQLWEEEPNDTPDEATGPIGANVSYYGYPNDRNDYFYFDMTTTGQISITLENLSGSGRQLVLYYQSPDNLVVNDANEPFQIIRSNRQPGRYLVRVYVESNPNTTTPYTLRVNYPVAFAETTSLDFISNSLPKCTPTDTPVPPTSTNTPTPTPTLTKPTSIPTAPQLFESFEPLQGVSNWEISDHPDNCATAIEATSLHPTDGSAAARFMYTYQQSVGDRCFYQRDINPHQDWSGKDRLVFDFWKDGPSIEVRVVVMTGNFFSQESPVRVPLINGQNTIEFDLTSNDWSGQTIKNLDDVLQLGIALYPSSDGSGELFVDNVRLLASSANTPTITPTATNTPTATPKPTSQYGYNFELDTQNWTTSEGEFKPITLTTTTQFVYSGVRAFQLDPNLRSDSSEVYRHTETVAYFNNTIPEGFSASGPYDLTGKSVSCFVYLPSELAPGGNPQAYIQLFVKDKDFRNQFNTALDIIPSNVNKWLQLNLIVGQGDGMDNGFDSKQSNALGISIKLHNQAILSYVGSIYIDHCDIQQP